MTREPAPVRTRDAAYTSASMAGRELRLALAMRGGVSLAVWIGGACAEIEHLRTSTDDGFYTQLLHAAGYASVTIDVLAGASAGGLNGALLSTSLMYGVPFARFRDIWIEVADIKALLRDTGEREPPSILRGDTYFLEQVRRRLSGLVAQAPSGQRFQQDYLDLTLTATLLDPVGLPVYEDRAGESSEGSHRALFRFRHNPYTSDFRFDGDPAASDAGVIAKLALAARSTSSFPGAFEPATVRTQRPEHVGRRARPEDHTDMFGLFSDASRTVHHVIDGGVLDNIPVGRAIDSIAAAKASGPTERWLLYLHPSPAAGEPTATAEATPHTIRSVLGAQTAKGTAESVLDDVAALRAHNDVVHRYRTVRQAVLGSLGRADAEGFMAAADPRVHDYRLARIRTEARDVRALLEDPASALGEDPFTSSAERWPLAGERGWDVDARDRLEEAVQAALAEGTWETASDVRTLGVEPLPRTIQACIEAVIRLEHLGVDPAITGPTKSRLYDVNAAAELLAHMGRLFWPVYGARHRPTVDDPGGWAAKALGAREALLAQPDTVITEAPDLFEPFTALRDELGVRLAPLALPPDGTPPAAQLWDALVVAVVGLASHTRDLPLPDRDDEAALFVRLLRHVHAPEPRDDDGAHDRTTDERTVEAERAIRAGRALTALEVLTFPLRALSPVPPQEIKYMRVAGSRRTPLEQYFPGGRLSVASKLAGNDLMNFSAFYKRSWRANDWMWGRMDAAASMIDLVMRPATIAAHFAAEGVPTDAPAPARAARFAKFVEDQVRAPLLDDLPEQVDRPAWSVHFDEVWLAASADVREEAHALFHGLGTDLAATREVLTTRRQWDVLLVEVPSVVRAVAEDGLDRGDVSSRIPAPVRGRVSGALSESGLLRSLVADRTAAAAPIATPRDLKEFLGDYDVGTESVADDIGSPRFTELVADLGLVAWRALRVGLGSRSKILTPVGVVLGVVRGLALATVRAPRWALLLLPLLAALGLYVAVENKDWAFGLNRVSGTVLFLAAVAVLLYWGRLRLVTAIATGGAIALAGWAAATAEASLSLAWGSWATTIGADGLRIALAVFVVIVFLVPRLWRIGTRLVNRYRS